VHMHPSPQDDDLPEHKCTRSTKTTIDILIIILTVFLDSKSRVVGGSTNDRNIHGTEFELCGSDGLFIYLVIVYKWVRGWFMCVDLSNVC